MIINKKLISKNFVKGRGGQKIKYIIWHDTWNFATSATAENHYKYFNGAYRGASAHYFIDQTQILQIINDEDTAWAVGDGNGKYGITNQNSISLEICVNDGDYAKEIRDAIALTIYLMKKHNVPLENVLRHWDASRKNCPSIMKDNNWKLWYTCMEELKKEWVRLNTPATPKQPLSDWAKLGREFVIKNNISDGERPKDAVTREEFWTMLERYDKTKGVK